MSSYSVSEILERPATEAGTLDGFEATCSCGLALRSSLRSSLEADVAEHVAYHARRAERVVHSLGGKMYGDGELVLEFHESSVAPLSATVIGFADGSGRELTFADRTKVGLGTARRALEAVRAQS